MMSCLRHVVMKEGLHILKQHNALSCWRWPLQEERTSIVSNSTSVGCSPLTMLSMWRPTLLHHHYLLEQSDEWIHFPRTKFEPTISRCSRKLWLWLFFIDPYIFLISELKRLKPAVNWFYRGVLSTYPSPLQCLKLRVRKHWKTTGVVQQRSPLSWLLDFIELSAVWADCVSTPVVSATSSTSCGRQSWRCRVTSRRPSCSGKRLTSIRLSRWSSVWETLNPCCPTPPTPTKRWWSCPAPGNCPSTPTLWLSSSTSSPSPPRLVGTDPVQAVTWSWQNIPCNKHMNMPRPWRPNIQNHHQHSSNFNCSCFS